MAGNDGSMANGMKGKQPYIPLYTGDWLKDPALSLCAPAARGVWIDLLCAMHEAGRSGELRGTLEQLARVARCSTADLTQALTEIQATEAADVTERNGVVTVVNRRMYREAKERDGNRLRKRRQRLSRTCPSGVPPPPSSSPSFSRNPPPPVNVSVDRIDAKTRRELEEEVFTCGVDQARPAIAAAVTAGCSQEEIRAVIAAWASRDDLGPGSLHYRLMDLQPGQEPERGWPKRPAAVVQKTKQDIRRRRDEDEALATDIIKKGRRAKKTDEEIVSELGRLGLEWPR